MSRTALIAKNTAVQVLGRTIGTVLALITFKVMTYYLGTRGYGDFTTVTTFLQFFGILVDFGLSLTAVAMLSEAHADRDRIASNLFSLRTVSAAAFFAIAPLVVLLLPYSAAVKSGVLVASASFFLISVNQVLVSTLQQSYRMGRSAVAEVLGRLGLLVVAVIAWHWNLGLTWMFVALIVGNLLTALWNWLLVRTLVSIRWAYDRATWLAIISRSWPIAMSIAFNLVYLKGDVLVLSLTRSSAEVGLYGAAYKILDVLTVVPMMFMGLVLPLLTRAWTTGDKPDFGRVLQKSLDFMAVMAAPLIVGTWVVGRDLMNFFASAAFSASGQLLGILIIACGAVFFGSTFGYAIIALGRQKAAVKWYAVDAVLSFAGYILFVPKWGAPAAAWVTVFSEAFIAVSTYLVVRQACQFVPKLSAAARSAAAAALMGLVILILPNHWHVLIRIALGAGLYAVAALTFGAVTPAQLKELRLLKKA